MRQRNLLLNTLREAPAEAETASHGLLLRAGYIRQLAAGIYHYLPLGRRVLRKLERIVREEMERAGAQEVLLPALQPAGLWEESGRLQIYGKELMTLKDRHDRSFVLGPTHEEVITSLVRGEINSYRRLPVTLYQIQTKFRDERRPRSGLLRGREFLMKDAYSFDKDWDSLDQSYQTMFQAYHRIFERCGLTFRAVEADPGAIGGEGGSHEFMALAGIGEDVVAACPVCGYAANLERAEARRLYSQPAGANATTEWPAIEKFYTPDIRTIDQLTTLGLRRDEIIKTLIYSGGGKVFAVLVRGDHEVNEIKLKKAADVEEITLVLYEEVEAAGGTESGYIGPVGLLIPIFVDAEVAAMQYGIAGAGEKDFHLRHVVPGRDFALEQVGDFRNVAEGERCPRCEEGELQFHRGIEIGHVFKLGTRYTEKLGARFLDPSGKMQDIIMGCYGIGISRLLTAVAEQHHDERGISWPAALAPFQVHILLMSSKDEQQSSVAEALYERLQYQGIEVLLDDRDERAGVKFKDAELLGIPYTVIVGKGAADGQIEFSERSKGEKESMSTEEVILRIAHKKEDVS